MPLSHYPKRFHNLKPQLNLDIDRYKRQNSQIHLGITFPQLDNNCACGCGIELTGRKTRWADISHATLAHKYTAVISGDVGRIRELLIERDGYICAGCGYDVSSEDWQADHIIEVRHGGGGCDLGNFQILCSYCHKAKTKANHKSNMLKSNQLELNF